MCGEIAGSDNANEENERAETKKANKRMCLEEENGRGIIKSNDSAHQSARSTILDAAARRRGGIVDPKGSNT